MEINSHLLNDDSQNARQLKEKLATIIKNNIVDIINIKELYECFAKTWKNNSCLYKGQNDKSKINKNYYIPGDAKQLGIDFPTWINLKDDPKQKRIMLVGIDPLRDPNNCPDDKVYYGTPYALHHKISEEKQSLKKYRSLINNLLKENAAVYLTDTFKVYYKTKISQSRSLKEFTHYFEAHHDIIKEDIHQKVFFEEVKVFKPDLIITMGKEPLIWFSFDKKPKPFRDYKYALNSSFDNWRDLLYYKVNEKHIVNILPIPHLSNRNRYLDDYWKSGDASISNEKKLAEAVIDLINK